MNKYIVLALAIGIGIGLPLGSAVGSGTVIQKAGGGGGVTDHGELTGLGDDDHTQYILHTDLDSESELESHLTDTTDVYTNNDFTEHSNNWDNAYTWSNSLYNTIGLSALTSQEVDQLENIGTSTISSGQWGYVGNMNQNVRTTDDVSFTDVTVADTDGSSTFNAVADTNDLCAYIWTLDDSENWRYQVDDDYPDDMYLTYTDATGTYEFLHSNLGPVFPNFEAFWGIGGATPTYGITQGSANTNHDKGYAHTWIDASSGLIKETFDIPSDKLLQFYDVVNITGYYNKDHYWDENGNLIIGNTDYSNFEVGCIMEDLKENLSGIFGNKVVNSFIYDNDFNNQTLGGISYRSLSMTLIQALRLKFDNLQQQLTDAKQQLINEIGQNRQHIKSMENFLENYGYTPPEWD